MRRFATVSLAVALAMAVAGSALAAPPPEEQQAPGADQAMVRFLHAAPNAQVESVVLAGGEEVVEEFAGLSYGQMSDYMPVPLGGYEVRVNLAGTGGEDGEAANGEDGEAAGDGDGDAANGDVLVEVPTNNLDTFAGEYYTIALIGLVQPEEPRNEDEGFFDWLSNLFTTDEDAYTLRTIVLSDGVTPALAEDEAELRIAHFAPGVEPVDLVTVNADGEVNVVHSVGYGDVSGFGNVLEGAGRLEIRAAGSEAVVFDMSDAELARARGHTIFLVGTPVEQVPLDVIVVENPQVEGGFGAPGAVAPGAVAFGATQLTMLRESLAELEERLAVLEDRISELEGDQEAMDAAQQELDEAMALVIDLREQVEAQPAPTPAAPPAQSGAGDAN